MKFHKDDHAEQPAREKIELELAHLSYSDLTDLIKDEINVPGSISNYIYKRLASELPGWKEHGWIVFAHGPWEGCIRLTAHRES